MILLIKLGKGLYLVQYNNTLRRSIDPLWKIRRRKDNVKTLRYVICKVTRLNAKDIRHVDNVIMHGAWVSRWIEIQ